MSLHPEDLYRTHQLLHGEMIRNHALERQANAARRPTRILREIVLHVIGFIQLRPWWRSLITLAGRRRHETGNVTTPPPDGALPLIAPTVCAGSSASSLTDPAPTTMLS